ncbi:MAG: aspartyl protease family protein [Planctomycetota bacterium]|nr:aspartyl protease family protein [Planctomycetota bacterium]
MPHLHRLVMLHLPRRAGAMVPCVALAFAATIAAASFALAAPPATQPATRPASTQPASTQPGSARSSLTDGPAVIILGTLQASMDYPRVTVQIRKGDKVVTGASTGMPSFKALRDLGDLDKLMNGGGGDKPDETFQAFLDTGASAHVISKSTAERFKIEATPNAAYHEVGLHGETEMGVSTPYALSIAGMGKADAGPPPFMPVSKAAIFQLSQAATNPLVEMVTGEVNVIGMPAIKQFLVEINPGGPADNNEADLKAISDLDLSDLTKPDVLEKLEAMSAGPSVRLLDGKAKPGKFDVEVPLAYTNFSRRKNPHDRGPLPDLADNPIVRNVKTMNDGKTFTGGWLLDTGAPASLISTKQAIKLGLYDKSGKPQRAQDFELPLGGIGGAVHPVPGFKIDTLIIPAANGRSLEYHNVYVLVNDVTTTLDDGSTVTLDGILGTNLWFPTVAGIETGLPTDAAASPFEMIWIDGPGARLLFKVRKP